MSKTIAIPEAVTLKDLRQQFGLQLSPDRDFFAEWRDSPAVRQDRSEAPQALSTPNLTAADRAALDRIRHRYRYYTQEDLMLEESIKMMIVSPLLEIAGLYDSPFRTQFENTIEIAVEGDERVYRGRLDTLTIQSSFWVLVVEAKRASVSIEVGIPQTLAYMLATPHPEKPAFGLVTNGSTFIFLKSFGQENPVYGKSEQFAIDNEGDLYQVVQIIRRIASLISQSGEG